jgi:membrane-associated phospholipid phosphatase
MSGVKWILYDWFGYNLSISQQVHLLVHNKCALSWLKKFSNALGDWHLFPVHLVLLLGTMYACLYIPKQQHRPAEAVRFLKHITLWLCSLAIGFVTIKTIKHVLHYARPYCTQGFNLTEYVHQFMHPEYCLMADYSFPSGHTAYITLFVASFWSLMDKKLKIISVFLISAMMFSRVVLSHHFVADTVYALLIVLYLVQPLSTALIARYYSPYESIIRRYADYIFGANKKNSA